MQKKQQRPHHHQNQKVAATVAASAWSGVAGSTLFELALNGVGTPARRTRVQKRAIAITNKGKAVACGVATGLFVGGIGVMIFALVHMFHKYDHNYHHPDAKNGKQSDYASKYVLLAVGVLFCVLMAIASGLSTRHYTKKAMAQSGGGGQPSTGTTD